MQCAITANNYGWNGRDGMGHVMFTVYFVPSTLECDATVSSRSATRRCLISPPSGSAFSITTVFIRERHVYCSSSSLNPEIFDHRILTLHHPSHVPTFIFHFINDNSIYFVRAIGAKRLFFVSLIGIPVLILPVIIQI